MLEGIDLALIERAKESDTEFRQLIEAHEKYEVQLLAFNDMPYLSSEQEVERKRLQKQKLLGKDRMIEILGKYSAK